MTNLFRYGGPYEIAISQYGSTIADLPIRFARQFGATFNTADVLIGTVLGGFVFYYLVNRFLNKTPRQIAKMIPIVGKSL